MKPLWWVKLTKFEYWTWWAFYLPLLPYYVWLSLKARSFAFFVSVNPGIPLGGMMGESKFDILKHIGNEFKPKTLLLRQEDRMREAEEWMEAEGIHFPIIAKPNVGERGKSVEKITHREALFRYLAVHASVATILQEYADAPLELGVFFYRLPNQAKGVVSSICIKDFLTVKGDGISTVAQLMEQNERARFQIPRLKIQQAEKLALVPLAGEELLLEPIGNHCRGTAFLNGNAYINAKAHAVFSEIASTIPGFYYGRFDLRVPNFDDLYAGRNIKVLELNGASAEPAHIYDPSYRLIKAYQDMASHWLIACNIAKQIGTQSWGFKELALLREAHNIANKGDIPSL